MWGSCCCWGFKPAGCSKPQVLLADCHWWPLREELTVKRSTDRKFSLSSPLAVAQTQERVGPSRTNAWLTSAARHKNQQGGFQRSSVICDGVRLFKNCQNAQRVCVISLTLRLLRATEARKVCVLRWDTVNGVWCTFLRVNTKASLNRKSPTSATCSKVLIRHNKIK